MAYGNYYPVTYNPYQQYQQPAVNYPQIQQPQQQGNFVRVPNETEARNDPVAPGNSVTFIDENAPYCYTKTAGFSQLDPPKFVKYRLVREDELSAQNDATTAANVQAVNSIAYAEKAALDALRAEFDALKSQVNELTSKTRKDDTDE